MRFLAAAIIVILQTLGSGPAKARVAAIDQAVIESYAIVEEDGTLRVRGQTVRLSGVYVPDAGRRCVTTIRPPRCASRAAVALDLKIQGFVRCVPQGQFRDGSLSAVCFVRDGSLLDPPLDLGAWLIEEGLAVALPNAPFQYTVLEKIARARGRGVWGFFADEIRPRR